jgi:hypothetical protein
MLPFLTLIQSFDRPPPCCESWPGGGTKKLRRAYIENWTEDTEMPDRAFEIEQLWRSERHIDRAQQIIADQQLELGRLRSKGYDTELAERTLEVLEDGLRTMYQHRNIIVMVIQQIDRGLV